MSLLASLENIDRFHTLVGMHIDASELVSSTASRCAKLGDAAFVAGCAASEASLRAVAEQQAARAEAEAAAAAEEEEEDDDEDDDDDDDSSSSSSSSSS